MNNPALVIAIHGTRSAEGQAVGRALTQRVAAMLSDVDVRDEPNGSNKRLRVSSSIGVPSSPTVRRTQLAAALGSGTSRPGSSRGPTPVPSVSELPGGSDSSRNSASCTRA